ncbi:MAG TPA: hypothetical protein RMH85_05935 [Polyangiaceae bacterium LLY-WYZ-15_(1-7)]|nr:hypothetical protein [Sandaracinus sp.]HJK91884.1 hypothetical protein [Polyangiaceae bacterium LLY-WYZ-15_(1-7)]MBJ70700.1 hypothetical protein [Sandaracinus sp.]HJL01754.1 hypothetical protein [Polyangiaceae bacterium LLY-WYZ-15_(1-7)]HJL08016.1 hypothetical protein [Polyangiaceae bacterium LLY-WYZ-15_(1-7)]
MSFSHLLRSGSLFVCLALALACGDDGGEGAEDAGAGAPDGAAVVDGGGASGEDAGGGDEDAAVGEDAGEPSPGGRCVGSGTCEGFEVGRCSIFIEDGTGCAFGEGNPMCTPIPCSRAGMSRDICEGNVGCEWIPRMGGRPGFCEGIGDERCSTCGEDGTCGELYCDCVFMAVCTGTYECGNATTEADCQRWADTYGLGCTWE